jgi:hypothetical protein
VSALVTCAGCGGKIEPGANRHVDPPQNVWCWWSGQELARAADKAAHEPGCLCGDPFCPAPRTLVSDFVRRLRRAFAAAGLAGCVTWAAEGRSAGWDSPELFHSELAGDPSRACSDTPGQVPAGLVVARTPCITQDLGEHDPAPDMRQGRHAAYKCRLGHVHYGTSPYGGDIPEHVRKQIAVSLGEEAGDD